jgi:hypothetical protein
MNAQETLQAMMHRRNIFDVRRQATLASSSDYEPPEPPALEAITIAGDPITIAGDPITIAVP